VLDALEPALIVGHEETYIHELKFYIESRVYYGLAACFLQRVSLPPAKYPSGITAWEDLQVIRNAKQVRVASLGALGGHGWEYSSGGRRKY
jgi:hypothetical protein